MTGCRSLEAAASQTHLLQWPRSERFRSSAACFALPVHVRRLYPRLRYCASPGDSNAFVAFGRAQAHTPANRHAIAGDGELELPNNQPACSDRWFKWREHGGMKSGRTLKGSARLPGEGEVLLGYGEFCDHRFSVFHDRFVIIGCARSELVYPQFPVIDVQHRDQFAAFGCL